MASHCYQDTSSSYLGTKITTYYRPRTRRKLLAATKHKRKLVINFTPTVTYGNLLSSRVPSNSVKCHGSSNSLTQTWHCTAWHLYVRFMYLDSTALHDIRMLNMARVAIIGGACTSGLTLADPGLKYTEWKGKHLQFGSDLVKRNRMT